MNGYWPSSFFFVYVFIAKTDRVEVHKHEANIEQPRPNKLAWYIKDLFYHMGFDEPVPASEKLTVFFREEASNPLLLGSQSHRRIWCILTAHGAAKK